MKKILLLSFFVLILLFSVSVYAQTCGNGICETGETVGTCPGDCKLEPRNYSVRLWLYDYIFSEKYLDFISNHYKYVMTSKLNVISELRERNQDIKIIYYTNPVFTQPTKSYPEEYYAHSESSTNYNKRILQTKLGMYLMDINSEAWRNEVATDAKNAVDMYGFYSVMADDCGSGMEDRVDFLPDDYEGKNKWVGDIKNTLSVIKNGLGDTVLIFNGIYGDINYPNRDYLEVADGGVREGFVFNLGAGEFLPEESWKVLLNWIIEDTQTDYHTANAKLKKKTWPVSETFTTDERMFAFTSYLLVKSDRVIYSPEDWGLVTGRNRTLAQYYPEMDIELGEPLQTASKVGDYFNLTSGLYEREFEKGKVFINPSTTQVTNDLDKNYLLVVPEGGGIITDEGDFGGTLSYQNVSQITVPAESGMILLNVTSLCGNGICEREPGETQCNCPEDCPAGDVNGDGLINIQDLQACVNHILGTQDWGEAADVNCDGVVNVLDIQEIVNAILGV